MTFAMILLSWQAFHKICTIRKSWFFTILTKLSHESWKISWFANSGMSAVWELQYIKKNMMNSATFGPKSFAQLRNVCHFFNLAPLFYWHLRLVQFFDGFYFDSTCSFFSFRHLIILPLERQIWSFFHLACYTLGHFTNKFGYNCTWPLLPLD